jgi:hypothetical protein
MIRISDAHIKRNRVEAGKTGSLMESPSLIIIILVWEVSGHVSGNCDDIIALIKIMTGRNTLKKEGEICTL